MCLVFLSLSFSCEGEWKMGLEGGMGGVVGRVFGSGGEQKSICEGESRAEGSELASHWPGGEREREDGGEKDPLSLSWRIKEEDRRKCT